MRMLLVAATCRIILFFVSLFLVTGTIGSWDSFRCLSQAESILGGGGFQRAGVAETYLPPGYTLFLTAILGVVRCHAFVVGCQLVLSILSCWFIYLALRPRSVNLAALSLVMLAINPMTARLSQLILSETLGVFLVSLLMLVLSRHEESVLGGLGYLGMGLLLGLIVLTSPATLFMSYGILAVVLVTMWHNKKLVACLLAGYVISVLPWHAYCLKHDGQIHPTVIRPIDSLISTTGAQWWRRSWVCTEEDLFCSPANPHISRRAFRSESERQRVVQLMETAVPGGKQATLSWKQWLAVIQSPDLRELASKGKLPTLGGSSEQDPAVDSVLREIGQGRARNHPVSFYLYYPMFRAGVLWLEGGRQCFGTPAGNWARFCRLWVARPTAKDYVQAMASLAILLLPPAYLVVFCYLAARAMWVNRRSAQVAVPAVIILSVIAYTAISACLAEGEPRRNTVFYPALLFVGFYILPRMPTRRQEPVSMPGI